MKFCGILFFLAIGVNGINAQINFHHTYGNDGNEYGRAIIELSDGGYVFTGSTNSFESLGTDLYLVKIDAEGNIVWGRNFGGNGIEWGYDLVETPEGDIMCAGFTNSEGNGGYDAYVIKTNSEGNKLWEQTYGGDGWDFGYSIQAMSNGNYLLGGSRTTDDFEVRGWLLSIDTAGEVIFDTTLDGNGEETIYSLSKESEGFIAFTGTAVYTEEINEIFAGRIDNNGEIDWKRNYPELGNTDSKDIYLSNQNTLLLGGTNYDIEILGMEEYQIANLFFDNGQVIYVNYVGGELEDKGQFCLQKPSGEIILGGYTNSVGLGGYEASIFHLTEEGQFQSNSFIQEGGTYDDKFFEGCITSDNAYIAIGETNSYTSNYQVYILKVDSLYNFIEDNTNIIDTYTNIRRSFQNKNNIVVYPQPALDLVKINLSCNQCSARITLSDLRGNILMDRLPYVSQEPFYINDLSSGIYILKVEMEDSITITKIIKL